MTPGTDARPGRARQNAVVPTRREFLRGAAASLAAGGLGLGCGDDVPPYDEPGDWSAGQVLHLLPAANHRRLRLKASFARPPDAPVLRVAGREAPGRATDSRGLHHVFDLDGLAPDRVHQLELRDARSERLCDPWPLRTPPAPDARPERFRLLAYTCAGGPEGFLTPRLQTVFRPIAVRRRLLARALAFAPDAVVANGDHVYWDMHSRYGIGMASSPQAWWRAGFLDPEQPVLGTDNEDVVRAAFGPQIAGVYGTLFRSVPTWFLQDDHDHGENDEAHPERRTFPPTPFMLDLARTTQRLYYPELLDDGLVPRAFVRGADRVAESFGSLRWGRLCEALLYDCRRHLTNRADPARHDAASGFLPPAVETWLVERSATSDADHVVNMPSTPVLWSAGKWGEWYPDGLDDDGALRAEPAKAFWPRGWKEQHDRLLFAAAVRRDRIPLFASGDLHALGMGRILRSGGLDLSHNPPVSLLTGPPGTGEVGWPSNFRGTPPRPSTTLDAEEWQAPLEENGFALLDFTRDAIHVRLFRWMPRDGLDAIATLEPFFEKTLLRGET